MRVLDGFELAEINARLATAKARYDLPSEAPDQAAAMDWISDLVRGLDTFTTRAQLGAAWNTEEALRHRAHLKAKRPITLAVLVDLVTQRRDQLPA